MTRIQPSGAFAAVPIQDLGQGDRINLGVAAIMGRLPAVAEALGSLTAALRTNGTLPPRLLELVRLRIAFFNQCRSCIAVRYQSAIDDGLDHDAVCSLERPAEAENLSAAEQSALHFAELFATDHLAIDDSVYEELREHFNEDQLVELGMHCAIALGVGRLSATWDVSDDLPETTASSERVAPWSSASVVASG
ncbi:carboxymuconolactone decarboxylase [Mycobacterium sp. E2327]|uniref:carboxymuconolactone decarboxylase family protein n=1 Tax=Mycobacterium sp. E2327 TaxID=1834132 RepID=UPI0007FC48EC|nr:carboxymuconolactone decarboxylase family protein [Mycobacterium sp. E2327]OBI17703.1 carboxymuconolactone decarboxylase [Mycobacterium sp. E2327]